MDSHDFGAYGEGKAVEYLEACGFNILARQVRYREGELDIIAEKENVIFVVEVKARKSRLFGDVVESITAQKIRRLRRAMGRWCRENKIHQQVKIYFLGFYSEKSGKLELNFQSLEDVF